MKLKDHGSKQSTKSAGNTLSEIIESQIPMCDANFTAMKQELPLIFCSITTELYSIVKSKYNIKKYDPVVSSEIIERSIFEYAEDEDAKMLTYEEALAQERTDEVYKDDQRDTDAEGQTRVLDKIETLLMVDTVDDETNVEIVNASVDENSNTVGVID